MTQGHSIIENIMEHMAAKLKMDPVEFRKANLIKEGDMTFFGTPYAGDNYLPQLVNDLEKSSDFVQRKTEVENFNNANKWKKRGISLVPVLYLVPHIIPMPFYCSIAVYQGDGSVSVSHGGIEMGQGINTKVAQTVAKELGIPMENIVVKPSDTLTSPNNCVTGGSTTSEVTCSVRFIMSL